MAYTSTAEQRRQYNQTYYKKHREKILAQQRDCLVPINPNLNWPDVGSLSFDHVVALTKGGTHTEANIKPSHLGCNIKKGNR